MAILINCIKVFKNNKYTYFHILYMEMCMYNYFNNCGVDRKKTKFSDELSGSILLATESLVQTPAMLSVHIYSSIGKSFYSSVAVKYT